MKKRRARIIIGILIPLLIVAGIVGGKVLNDQLPRHRQIEFLKEHETEITNEIKRQDSRVTRVTYTWDSLQIRDSGPFTQECYDMDVDVYNSGGKEFSGGNIGVYVDNISNPTKITNVAIPYF